MHVLVQANAMARKAQTQFFAADTTGFFGFVFEDLGDVFAYEKTIKNEKEGTKETKRLVTGFVELENALQSPWKVNTSMVFIMLLGMFCFLENVFSPVFGFILTSLSSTACVLGETQTKSNC